MPADAHPVVTARVSRGETPQADAPREVRFLPRLGYTTDSSLAHDAQQSTSAGPGAERAALRFRDPGYGLPVLGPQ